MASEHSDAGDVDDRDEAPMYGTQCFLCLRPFTAQLKATVEDVVPKWLIKFADLAGTVSTLPSGQKFRYPQRAVPCCIECNQFMSVTLESPVSVALKAGFAEVEALPHATVLLWLAKIFYGTRWRELALRVDVADSDSPTFNTPQALTGTTEYLRQLLLSGPEQVAFATPPASLFLYRAGIPQQLAHQFDFFVASMTDVIALRAGEVFVVAIFGEGGYWHEQFDGSPADISARAAALHPAQCIEIMLFMATRAARLEWSGRWDFINIGDGDPTVPGGISRVFNSSFTGADSGIPAARLDKEFAATFLHRAFGFTAPPELLLQAERGQYPTCLRNPANGEPVVATCFELTCPAVRLSAGWELDPAEPACPSCGAAPQPPN